ncbi:MAG: hypothetical protein ORN98_10385, partial [Alphaproteobacteria bacterium]|nr:hypothetical protein [Alphaproteobacteria bacterium]
MMSQISLPTGTGGLQLEKSESFYEIFSRCIAVSSKTSGFHLICSKKKFLDIVAKADYELRRHYPNIKGHSAVKWAGHLCSAIHHVRPIQFSSDGHPKPTQKPDIEFILNCDIAITFAIELIEKDYRSILYEKQKIKDGEPVFSPRSEFFELLRNTLYTVPYTV